jgi:hypothetical protein
VRPPCSSKVSERRTLVDGLSGRVIEVEVGWDTRGAIKRAGFVIDWIDQLTTADTQMPFPPAPQVIGVTTRR